MWKTWVQFLGWEDPLEKGMSTYSSILAWNIPWTEEPVDYSPWGRKESYMTERLSHSFLVNCECLNDKDHGKPIILSPETASWDQHSIDV